MHTTCTRNRLSWDKTASGFTLLEILLAIVILAFLVTTVLGSFNTVFMNTETLQEGMTDYEMTKNCMERMTVDLKSIHVTLPPKYVPPGLDDPLDPHLVKGENMYLGGAAFSKIRFTSGAHISLDRNFNKGIAEIVYYVQETEENEFVLKRADKLYPYEPFVEKASDPVLCEKIKLLAFKYYDIEGNEFEDWDSESDKFGYATPVAVSFELELTDESPVPLLRTMVKLQVHRLAQK